MIADQQAMYILAFSIYLTSFSCCVREMGDSTKRKPYVPAEKQYLITCNGNLCLTIALYCFYRECKTEMYSDLFGEVVSGY